MPSPGLLVPCAICGCSYAAGLDRCPVCQHPERFAAIADQLPQSPPAALRFLDQLREFLRSKGA